jgi:hypothetical protein
MVEILFSRSAPHALSRFKTSFLEVARVLAGIVKLAILKRRSFVTGIE